MGYIVEDIFYRIFSYDYNSCFLSQYWLKKVIKNKYKSKEKKKSDMLKLVNCLHRHTDKSLDEALTHVLPSKKSQTTIMNAFHKIQLSPIAIQSSDIPYMQSIESLLEFKNPGTNVIKYFDMIKSRSRGKEVFCYGGNNY